MKKLAYFGLMAAVAGTWSAGAYNIGGYHRAEDAVRETMFSHPKYSVGEFEVTHSMMAQAPTISEVSWVKDVPAELMYDQEQLGSCTANAAAYILRGLSVAASATPHHFLNNPMRLDSSRLYHYYNTRKLSGDLVGQDMTQIDTGGSMIGAVLALDRYGITPESGFADDFSIRDPFLQGATSYSGWGYDNYQAYYTVQPDPEAYRLAYDVNLNGFNTGTIYATRATNPYSIVSRNLQYQDLASRFSLQHSVTAGDRQEIVALFRDSFSKGRPVYGGIELDDTFMHSVSNGGFVPMPNFSTFRPTGGHAISFVGHGQYNLKQGDRTNYFKFANSWGAHAGQNGYFFLPEDYLTNAPKIGLEALSLSLHPESTQALHSLHRSMMAAEAAADDVDAEVDVAPASDGDAGAWTSGDEGEFADAVGGAVDDVAAQDGDDEDLQQ